MLIHNLAFYFCNTLSLNDKLRLLQSIPSSEKLFIAPINEFYEDFPFLKSKILLLRKDMLNCYNRAEQELKHIEANNINTIFYTDNEYSKLLKECNDAPIILFYKGNYKQIINKNTLSIVGTRRYTAYGKEQTKTIIEGLKYENLITISGLAEGIDSFAHKYSLEYNLPTLAVVGHGLDRIYPENNYKLAEEILQKDGCIITEMPFGTPITRYIFPRRNRIIAGLSDATLVIEASYKGGALITAKLANSYDRSVFAIPGRNDSYFSKGCNYLIKKQIAFLIENSEDIISELNWLSPIKINTSNTIDKNFLIEKFKNLDSESLQIIDLLIQNQSLDLDSICENIELDTSKILSLLLNLEIKGFITTVHGNSYQLKL